jgi:hypothetical protein
MGSGEPRVARSAIVMQDGHPGENTAAEVTAVDVDRC